MTQALRLLEFLGDLLECPPASLGNFEERVDEEHYQKYHEDEEDIWAASILFVRSAEQ